MASRFLVRVLAQEMARRCLRRSVVAWPRCGLCFRFLLPAWRRIRHASRARQRWPNRKAFLHQFASVAISNNDASGRRSSSHRTWLISATTDQSPQIGCHRSRPKSPCRCDSIPPIPDRGLKLQRVLPRSVPGLPEAHHRASVAHLWR